MGAAVKNKIYSLRTQRIFFLFIFYCSNILPKFPWDCEGSWGAAGGLELLSPTRGGEAPVLLCPELAPGRSPPSEAQPQQEGWWVSGLLSLLQDWELAYW